MIATQKQKISRLQSPQNIEKSETDFYRIFNSIKPIFILECKIKSPTKGKLTNKLVLDLAKMYEPHADILSILTNEEYFSSSLCDLKIVSEKTNKPILCKDIIVDPIQIKLARAHGAHGILLMLSVLDDATYLTCQQLAHEYGMGVITEVITAEEVKRAIYLDAKVIGINNRNLFTLKENLNKTIELSRLIPKSIPIISASGIQERVDIERLQPYASGFLIGSSLSSAPNPEIKLRELLYGHIKICGLTRKEDAITAYQLGATMGGLNFIPESARVVNMETALEIKRDVNLKWFGVFAKQSVTDIIHIAAQLNLNAVLIFDKNNSNFYAHLRATLPASCEIWQTVSIDRLFDAPEINGFVLDSHKTSLYWEKGIPFDWRKIDAQQFTKPFLLAGGLTPSNIVSTNKTGAFGYSINSGVESAPGIKDKIMLQTLFNALRGTYAK